MSLEYEMIVKPQKEQQGASSRNSAGTPCYAGMRCMWCGTAFNYNGQYWDIEKFGWLVDCPKCKRTESI